jgi:hypothetical protein
MEQELSLIDSLIPLEAFHLNRNIADASYRPKKRYGSAIMNGLK